MVKNGADDELVGLEYFFHRNDTKEELVGVENEKKTLDNICDHSTLIIYSCIFCTSKA